MSVCLTPTFLYPPRPLLEYNTVVWSPSLKCDIWNVEKVQQKFTKRLPGYSKYSYAERRRNLNLITLELRRLHYDLVMCYKIIFNIVNMECADFFVLNTVSFTRGHPYKLYVNHCRTNVRRNFFTCCIVKVWNSLPTDRVDFGSLGRFRRSLHNIDFSSLWTHAQRCVHVIFYRRFFRRLSWPNG